MEFLIGASIASSISGFAEVSRYGRTPPVRGKLSHHGICQTSTWRAVPIVREVFVVKHGHRAFALLLEDLDNLAGKSTSAAKKATVPLEISWIIPHVFTDYDEHLIHSKFAPPSVTASPTVL